MKCLVGESLGGEGASGPPLGRPIRGIPVMCACAVIRRWAGVTQFALEISSSTLAVSTMLPLGPQFREIELNITCELGDEVREGTLIPTLPSPNHRGHPAEEAD